jgi:hypothetical protein
MKQRSIAKSREIAARQAGARRGIEGHGAALSANVGPDRPTRVVEFAGVCYPSSVARRCRMQETKPIDAVRCVCCLASAVR